MAYVIKNFFFQENSLFQTNKYFNFVQLLLSSVVSTGELLYKQAMSYSLYEPSQNTTGSV